MAEKKFTPYAIIAKAFSRIVPANILQNEDPNLYNINRKAKEKNAEVPYPMDKYGTNLGSNPANYLGYLGKVIFKDTGLDQGRTYLSDGRTEINKELAYPIGTIVHEAQHARDINSKYKSNDYSKASNIDQLLLQDKLTGESISKKFNELATNKRYEDPYLFMAYTKQTEPDEVVAQLKQYESLLPAGMTIFQSPLGKDLFKNDEAKRWWLTNTTDSMSSINLQK